jgi:two-component system sensor kinase FixL
MRIQAAVANGSRRVSYQSGFGTGISGTMGAGEELSVQAVAHLRAELAQYAQLVRDQAASIAHYKKMFDRSSALAKIGVWEFDLATEELTWTDGVNDLFQLPRGAALKRADILDLYDDDSRREMEELRAKAIREGSGFKLDIRVQTVKGRTRWIRLTADVEQENGRSARLFGTKQDVSEEKAAQERVQRLQAELIHASRKSAMGVMATTLAHELNQPLTAITSYAVGSRRMLGDPAFTTEILKANLSSIERNALRAGGIIRNLRAMTNESAVGVQSIDPNALIEQAVALARACADGITVRYGLAKYVELEVDPVQLQQVFINLIRNAVEAMKGSAKQELSILSAVRESVVEFHFNDSGPGMPSSSPGSLFDCFASPTSGRFGTGLPISRTIVEAYGGRISARNLDAGGASFCVSLPLARADSSKREHPSFRN